MLEYPIEEAAALLQKNLSSAQQSLQEVGEDLDFISDQCTIVEVGILQVTSEYCFVTVHSSSIVILQQLVISCDLGIIRVNEQITEITHCTLDTCLSVCVPISS